MNATHKTERPATHLPTVTVLGAGTMGTAIVRRLLGAGMAVGVWDRNPEPAHALIRAGATLYTDARDAVSMATVVLTFLPTADAVTDVALGRGVLDAMAHGATWAQMGTIGPDATELLDREVRARRPDVRFVDAPVSGSKQPAESGQLLVLASGPDAAAEGLQPVFDVIGRRTLWLGPAGTGSRMKLVLNTWLAFEVEAAAEAAALAAHLGIPASVLQDAIVGNPAASPLATAKLSKIEAADYSTEFALGWALKDLDLATASAGPAYTPIAAAIADRWRDLTRQGLGRLDVSAAGLGLSQPIGAGSVTTS
jgi:3-hydroxyisobutyrate dehydrogenase